MESYLKITSNIGGSRNVNLERAIMYIGEHKAIIKEWRKTYIEEHYAALRKLGETEWDKNKDNYFKCGVKIVAKCLGRFRKNAVRYMVYPKTIKKSDNKQWYYNEQTYANAFGCIIDFLERFLRKCPPNEKDYLKNLINELYQQIRNNQMVVGVNLKPMYSNALLYRQKDMLTLHANNLSKPEKERKSAEKILREIEGVDRPFP